MLKKALFVILSLFSLDSLAQINNYSAFNFDQFNHNIAQDIPSITDTSHQITIFTGSRNYFGAYKGVNSNYFHFNFLSSKTKNQKHSFGIQISQSNLGQFIRYNSAFANYNIRFSLTKKIDLTAGANLGFNSLLLDPSSAGGGGTSRVTTTSLGLGFVSKKITLLCSYTNFLRDYYTINQNTIPSPISFKAYLMYNKALNSKNSIFFHLLSQTNSINKNLLNGLIYFERNDSYNFGAGYRLDRGLFVLLGLKNIKWNLVTTDISMSYLAIPSFKIAGIPNQILELTIHIKI